MRLFSIVLLALLLLPACESVSTPEYTPEYLKEDSPLDPPGTAAARQAMRAERVKEGKFSPDSTVEVQEGRVFLHSRNPEYTPEAGGRMVESAEAKVISCEGLYYFVELDGGKRGYLRESDLVSPVELVPTDPMLMASSDLFAQGAPLPVEGAAPMQLDENQTLTTNEDGRPVVLVGKKSERSAEFEERRKAIEGVQPEPEPAPSGGDEPPPLPEPSGGQL